MKDRDTKSNVSLKDSALHEKVAYSYGCEGGILTLVHILKWDTSARCFYSNGVKISRKWGTINFHDKQTHVTAKCM